MFCYKLANVLLFTELYEMQIKIRDHNKAMTQLRNQSNETIEDLEKFHSAEKLALNNEKIRLEADLNRMK